MYGTIKIVPFQSNCPAGQKPRVSHQSDAACAAYTRCLSFVGGGFAGDGIPGLPPEWIGDGVHRFPCAQGRGIASPRTKTCRWGPRIRGDLGAAPGTRRMRVRARTPPLQPVWRPALLSTRPALLSTRPALLSTRPALLSTRPALLSTRPALLS